MIAKQYTIYNNSSVSRDSYGSWSTTNNCNVGEDGLGVHNSDRVPTPFNAHHGG